MAVITVQLRIVGVYFNHPVIIDTEEVQTVKGVMETYRLLNPDVNVKGGVDFKFTNKGSRDDESLSEVIYNYPGKYSFTGGIMSTNGETLGGKVRKEGLLRLAEQELTPTEGVKVSSVWQYYVIGEDGNSRSATKPNQYFEGYDNVDNQYKKFKDGDTIIWRLVVLTLPQAVQVKNGY